MRKPNLARFRRLTTWPSWAWTVAHFLGVALLCAATAVLYCSMHGGTFIGRFWHFMAYAVPLTLAQYAWRWYQRRRLADVEPKGGPR